MIQHKYINVNGIKLHFAFEGNRKNPVIIFLHGFPECWEMWKKQIEEFSKDFFVVALDMRGYNLSSKPVEVDKYKMKYLMEDVRQLIEYLKCKKVVLVGHDWGGIVAWSFASYFREYLNKLIIINAPHPNIFDRELRNNVDQKEASKYTIFFCKEGFEKILSKDNYSLLLNGMGVMTGGEREAYIERWSDYGLIGGLNYYRATNLTNASADKIEDFKVDVPTLIIWGEKDSMLLIGCTKDLDSYISDCTVITIDASHWIIREKPDFVNTKIRNFLEN